MMRKFKKMTHVSRLIVFFVIRKNVANLKLNALLKTELIMFSCQVTSFARAFVKEVYFLPMSTQSLGLGLLQCLYPLR